jgi:hypothetical protein
MNVDLHIRVAMGEFGERQGDEMAGAVRDSNTNVLLDVVEAEIGKRGVIEAQDTLRIFEKDFALFRQLYRSSRAVEQARAGKRLQPLDWLLTADCTRLRRSAARVKLRVYATSAKVRKRSISKFFSRITLTYLNRRFRYYNNSFW